MKLTTEAAALTDVGIVRHNNEDNFAYDTDTGVFVLCDGMGGQAAGEVASSLAIQTVMSYFAEAERTSHFPKIGDMAAELPDSSVAVMSAIRLANQAVREASAENKAQTGMGCTIVVARVHTDSVTIGHVGDSRAYLLREGELRPLTIDHSLVMEQVRRGYITEEQAEHSTMQNILLRALGADHGEPDVQEVSVEQDDVFVLLCDGIYKVLSKDELKAALQSSDDLEKVSRALVDAAKAHNSDDNLTCVLFRVHKARLLARANHKKQSSI